ncbi:MAG: DnaA/Hda family protein [bacterium]|nr:DnaA/Hda family protein [bacterium]
MVKLRLAMENTSAHILWKKTLGVIETEVSKANFLTLFKTTTLLSLENDTATIAAPSIMIIDLIQKRFFNLLKSTMDKHAGKNLKIVFIPKNINKPNARKEKNGPLFVEDIIQRSNTANTISFLPRVRKDYVFETLAVSGSNQLAYISATTVAGNLGRSYNPLFIYGPVGVGKTHLMQAIANDAYKKNPTIKIVYITSEEFTNEVVEAIRTNQTHIMKKRFRTVKLLIIDDVQFIAGKDKVQEELFHTFNILIDNGAQVVLSSDRPPAEIKKLEKRLSSRFSGGLTVDIEAPDFELRTAILLIKAKKYNIELPIEAAKKIAEKNQDTRSLEGELLRVITESQAKKEAVTVELAARVL